MKLFDSSQPAAPPTTCASNLLQNAGFENNFTIWEGMGGSISATAAAGAKALQLAQSAKRVGKTRR